MKGDYLGDIGVDGRVTFKSIFRQLGVKVRYNSGLLWRW
jgi:hypothetical protein